MWRACGHQPPILGCSARGSVLRGEKKNEICACSSVCVCGCVAQSTSSARFPLCQSVAAMEHPGLAQPSISRLPWLSAYRHTHTDTHTNLWQPSVQRKTKATRDFIKRLQLLCMWAWRKKDFLSQDSIQTTGHAASSFSQFLRLSHSADSNLEDIHSQFHKFVRHQFYICAMLETAIPLVRALKIKTRTMITILWPSVLCQDTYHTNSTTSNSAKRFFSIFNLQF